MYAFMTGGHIPVTAAMMILAWNVSGGHFNPGLTVAMFISRKNYKNDAPVAGLMIVG